MSQSCVVQEGRHSITIGTRGSRLAIWQAEWIREQMLQQHPSLSVTLCRITTSGDKMLDVPLAKIGGKGLFVKEIEEALLSGEIDVAVHSMKDMPVQLPTGLDILCIPAREDARDVFLSRTGIRLSQLPRGATIGTSSLRRQAQLLAHRPDLRVTLLRGNLDTRLRKLVQGQYDGIVLAAAGLVRLGWAEQVTEYLPVTVCLPAIGQGALAVEGRQDDLFVRELLSPLDHGPTRVCVQAERGFLHRLQGGCQVPIGGHARLTDDGVLLEGLIASTDGHRLVRGAMEGSRTEAEAIGVRLAEQLLMQGGGAILRDMEGHA